MGELQHVSASATADEVVAILRSDGAVVVDDLAPAGLLDRFEGELAPWLAATPYGAEDFAGRATRRTGALVARCPAARELLQHPLILGATSALLADSTTFHVHLTQAISIGPGQAAQPIHRDQWAFDFFSFPEGYDVQCNTIWALTDFTEANGATRVVPGSNRGDVDRLGAFTLADSVPAEMARGSVLVYSGSVHHGGGANTSDEVRTGINLTYARSWLRQEENQYLSVPLEVARTLDDDLLACSASPAGPTPSATSTTAATRSTSSAAVRARWASAPPEPSRRKPRPGRREPASWGWATSGSRRWWQSGCRPRCTARR